MSNLSEFPYIPRAADQELLDCLTEKRYCYIKSPPGTGKTLLLNKIKERLVQSNVKCAAVSLRITVEEIDNW